jgi:2-polyprenyl-3-methyl-5-hydroxy-6-metoxy-1,4-benzoquinol methylase
VTSDGRDSAPEQIVQERQYYLPYHYIPRRLGGRIVYAARLDWAAEYLKSIEIVAAAVASTGARQILDIGCGDGRLVNELSGRFNDRRFVGLDYSQRAIALADVYRENANAQFIAGTLESAGLPRATFDLVTLIEVLEHIPITEAWEFARRAFDMLAAGGVLLVTVPHANKPVQRKHFQHFTGDVLARLLSSATGQDAESVDLRFIDRQERGLAWLRSRLATNRFFTVEPLLQAELQRRSALSFVPEERCGRIVAQIRRR